MPKTTKPKKPKKLKKLKKVKSVKASFYTAIRKANKKRPASSLELTVYRWLEELGIPFVKEKAIGRCHVDIFIEPDIALEVQGCHWHCCEICKPEQTKKDLAKRYKDAKRICFFLNKGYKVVEIWGHEILDSPEKVKERLRRLVSDS